MLSFFGWLPRFSVLSLAIDDRILCIPSLQCILPSGPPCGLKLSVTGNWIGHPSISASASPVRRLPNDCLIIVVLVFLAVIVTPWALCTTLLHKRMRQQTYCERFHQNWAGLCVMAKTLLLARHLKAGPINAQLSTRSEVDYFFARRLHWTFGCVPLSPPLAVHFPLLVRLKFILLKIDLKKFDLKSCF